MQTVAPNYGQIGPLTRLDTTYLALQSKGSGTPMVAMSNAVRGWSGLDAGESAGGHPHGGHVERGASGHGPRPGSGLVNQRSSRQISSKRVASAAVSGADSREWRCGEYVISDDPDRFDADALHDFLEIEGYWAQGRSREQTAVGAANSVVLGVYGPDGSMVGGARVVTDRATFGWLTDVYVLAEYRGRGLGRAVVAAACEHPAVTGIKRVLLRTVDAHELYRSLGFEEPPAPERWMELRSAPGALSGGTEAADEAGGGGTEPSAGGNGATCVTFDVAVGPQRYTAWQGGGLPDPRTAPVSQIATYLLEIVSTEGPVTADRAYRIYIRGAGSSKVTQRAREPMQQALGRLTLRGQVEADEVDHAGSHQQVLRLTGTPPVVVRELSERSLYEVPLNEIAELMGHKRRDLVGRSGASDQPAHAVADVIRQAALRRASPERLMRAVLDSYGLIRMTQVAEQYLSAALALLDEPE